MGGSLSELQGSTCASCISKQIEKAEATVQAITAWREEPVEWVQGYHVPSVKASLATAKDDVLLLVAEGMQDNGEEMLCERANSQVTGRSSVAGYIMKVQWSVPASSQTVAEYLATPTSVTVYDSRVLAVDHILTLTTGITIATHSLKATSQVTVASHWESLESGAVVYSASVTSAEQNEQDATAHSPRTLGGFYAEQRGSQSKVTGIYYMKLNPNQQAELAHRKCLAIALVKTATAITQALTHPE